MNINYYHSIFNGNFQEKRNYIQLSDVKNYIRNGEYTNLMTMVSLRPIRMIAFELLD